MYFHSNSMELEVDVDKDLIELTLNGDFHVL